MSSVEELLPQITEGLSTPQNIEKISFDLDAVLGKLLSRYNDEVIVMDDCLVLAKKDVREIKDIKKKIKEAEKTIIAEMEKPILEFKSRIALLVQKCLSAEETIKQRIDFFSEQEREKLVATLKFEIQKELRRNYLDISLEEKVDIDDLLKNSSKCLTKTGALTKYAREAIELKVEKLAINHVSVQQKQPLVTPNLNTPASINLHFSPKKENVASEENLQNTGQMNQGLNVGVFEKQNQNATQEAFFTGQENEATQETMSKTKKTKRKFLAVFELEVDENISTEKLEEMLKNKLIQQGFKSLKSVNSI